MTIDQVLRRVVRGHAVLIVACVVLSTLAVGLYIEAQPKQWQATTRMQVASTAPGTASEAAALSSQVLAVATTPAVLREAAKTTGLTGDLDKVAQRVTVERLGESAVVRLSYVGDDRTLADEFVGVLAADVTRLMNSLGRKGVDSALATVDQQMADAQRNRQQVLTQLSDTRGRIARTNVKLALAGVTNNIIALAQQRSSLVVEAAARDRVAVLDGNGPDVQVVSSGLVPRAALGALFGLMLGLALAATAEVLRPRIGGARDLARSLGVPLVGEGMAPEDLGATLTLAARRRGVETLVLVPAEQRSRQATYQALRILREPAGRVGSRHGVSPRVPGKSRSDTVRYPAAADNTAHGEHVDQVDQVDRTDQIDQMDQVEQAEQAEQVPAGTAMDSPFGKVRFTTMSGLEPGDEFTAGVMVVSATSLRGLDLERLQDVLTVSRWPVVGVLDMHGTQWSPR
jgi:capsular polysaccharide biosynthesis protein